MANKAVNTEHSGSKKASGYYGRRERAKKESNKARRENDKRKARG